MTKFENLPKEVQEKMLGRQFEQTGKRDAEVFKLYTSNGKTRGGFDWDSTVEDYDFWYNIICEGNYEKFFEKYPREESSPYPKLMWVSDQPIGEQGGLFRVVFMEKSGKFLAWEKAESLKEAEEVTEVNTWKYAKNYTLPSYTKEDLVKKLGHDFNFID